MNIKNANKKALKVALASAIALSVIVPEIASAAPAVPASFIPDSTLTLISSSVKLTFDKLLPWVTLVAIGALGWKIVPKIIRRVASYF